ncbi:4Fe-4S binding protein [Heliobacterium chlorum]|uniref:4Fe-4S binding protein n=1 Tax=Heliobacterium chlorum TaxID=2698 RepID=A0ABR7T3A4_HELCL|nr:4Fe-4S binding protein [Heliobacterium chlorum]MBC9784026.1 4Fe-4S binding protein [Heliobacterium chlorum]
MAYQVNADGCVACGACQFVCPASCVSEVNGGIRIIDEPACTDCGSCVDACPANCIFQV